MAHILGEWISGAVCMYVANYLCENYGKDMQVFMKKSGIHTDNNSCICNMTLGDEANG